MLGGEISMWNDRETHIDFIGHSIIAGSIKELIYDDTLSPLTIGVFGDWGVGKSSVLKMVEKACEDDKETLCLTFNGWLFQGYDDAKSVLMEVIIRELSEQRGTGDKVVGMAKKLLKKIDWFRVAKRAAGMAVTAGLFGVPLDAGAIIERCQGAFQEAFGNKADMKKEDMDSAFDAVKESFKNDSTEMTAATAIHEFRKEFQELMEICKVKRLVILVDDLDRCLPNTAIEALEAIRLFLFVQGTTFIIAADENMIAYAVRRHFPDLPVTGRPLDYPRSYLEKLIQVPFRIPNLNFREVQNYIGLLLLQQDMKDQPERFEQLHTQRMAALQQPWSLSVLDEQEVEKIVGTLTDNHRTSIRLAHGVAMQLTEGLSGNPRQIKRFLNTLMLRYRIAKAFKVDSTLSLQVLVKLMMLERFREAIYVDLMGIAARSPDGKCEVLQRLEQAAKEGNDPIIKGLDGEQQAVKWLEDTAWFAAWAKMEPSIGLIDIRPYMYISKDKSLGFSLEAELGGDLGQIAADILSASHTLQMTAEKKLSGLIETEAKRLFDFLLSRSGTADWQNAPKEVLAFLKVAKCHAFLQKRVLEIFENRPPIEMGSWALPLMNDCITDKALQAPKEALRQKWAQDTKSFLGRAAKAEIQKGGK